MTAYNMNVIFVPIQIRISETLKPMSGHIEWALQDTDISVTSVAKALHGTPRGRDINSPRKNVLHHRTHPYIEPT